MAATLSAHGNIVLYAVCPACRAGRCLFFEQFCSRRTVAEQRTAKFCEKEEKKKTKEGKKVSPRRQGSVCPQPEYFFLVHEYLGSERPVSFEVSAPTRLNLRGSHVQRKFRKRTTLPSESSTLIGLLYAG